MDEIDWMKIVKKAVILCAKICGGFAIFMVCYGLIFSGNDWRVIGAFLVIALLITIGMPLLFWILYSILIIIQKISNLGRTVISFDKEYVRDLPKHCSPAISSLIYDLKIDVYKDYTATILYLCLKKYLIIKKDGDSYKVKIEEQKDLSNLDRCEKYVLDIIQNKNIFDENKFKQEIIKEAQERNLITDKKYSKKDKIIVILLVSISLLLITYNINKIIFAILLSIIWVSVFAGISILQLNQENNYIIDTEYIRTEDGKKIALLLKGLKRYIKEYTLIKEKDIDYIQILEDYIPYAIALDEADAIEEYIKHNEEYRDLIYNRKIDKF